jgi:hypothetical protein
MTNITPATAPLQQHDGKVHPASLRNVWQRTAIFAGLAFMLMLLGFDLMGLLVLYMH